MSELTLDRPPQNLILIGFMGCGKSTIGHQLHRDLGYPQIDTDHLIEKRQGLSIAKIFEQRGEKAFRAMESSLLRELIDSQLRCHIISTGGGLPLQAENQALLPRLGYVVWLDASPEIIFDRVSRNQNRPLLQTPDPEKTVRELLEQRRPIYEAASHMRIKTDTLTCNEIAYGIIESARVFFSSLKEVSPRNEQLSEN